MTPPPHFKHLSLLPPPYPPPLPPNKKFDYTLCIELKPPKEKNQGSSERAYRISVDIESVLTIAPLFKRPSVMSQSFPTEYIPAPGNPRGLAQKHCSGGRDLTFKSCPGAENSTRAGILWKFKVKHFVRVLVLSVINTGCPKNC